MHKLGIIIATKDRPQELRTMLRSLAMQSRLPEQVIVVDGGLTPDQAIVAEFDRLPITYLRHRPPSAATQRNAGLAALAPDIDLVGFMDDDIVLEHGAIQRMIEFWEGTSHRVGGAAFNWLNSPLRPLAWLKRGRWAAALGLYPVDAGGVAPSGWQDAARPVQTNTRVRWLPTGACVWRRDALGAGGFDPYFAAYSYLEDLDFSYERGKRFELYTVAAAGFEHHPAAGGRIGRYEFGRIEVLNRLYLVRKHGLSRWRCYLGLGIRLCMTVAAAIGRLSRAELCRGAGNVVALLQSLLGLDGRAAKGAGVAEPF